jgi:hypothetical protein
MHYDTRNDMTTFVGNTKAWNNNHIILSDYGLYKPNENKILFSENVYMQSESQETWADSVIFDDKTKNAKLFCNIQMTDTTQNLIIFGDNAQISDNYETVVVTDNPAALYYSIPQTPNQTGDTTYLTADTICTMFQTMKMKIDCDTCKITVVNDEITQTQDATAQDITSENTSLLDAPQKIAAKSKMNTVEKSNVQNFKSQISSNTVSQNFTDQNTATPDITQQDTAKIKIVPDTLSQNIITENTINTDTLQQDTTKLKIESDTVSQNIAELNHKNSKFSIVSDTASLLIQDTTSQTTIITDTTSRNIFAYRNVKIFKSDFQALCDSLVYHSLDSTTYMYHLPILWNDSMQITSGAAAFYSKNRQIDYAEFTASPLVIMLEDSTHFSQMKGKSMKAFFKNNQLDSINVSGNGQSIYYIREKPEKPISAVETSECGNILIKMMLVDGKNKINKVSYSIKPSSNTYPLDKIPEDSKELKGFVWHDDIRPKSKNDLFGRKIHQSQRQLTQTFAKPTFTITKRINSIE